MSFQGGIGSLGGTVFFQVGLCTPLQTMVWKETIDMKGVNSHLNNSNLFLDEKISSCLKI